MAFPGCVYDLYFPGGVAIIIASRVFFLPYNPILNMRWFHVCIIVQFLR